MNGLVIKKNADRFFVLTDGEVKECVARKNLKKNGVFVGDNVEIDENFAVNKVLKRKNLLIRPPMANVDKMFIVVAPVPKPDFYMVDKLIVFCKLNSIEPIVCINKADLDENLCSNFEKIYKDITKTLIFSSFDESVQKILSEIDGICVLAGQSAVGKSSIINALTGKNIAKVGDFSKKIERGKQTTRLVELFMFGDGKFLADTAGFSKLDERLLNLDASEVKDYFDEFLSYAQNCKYKSCQHISNCDCGVLKAVKAGKISLQRYENYKKLVVTIKSLKPIYN